MRLYFDKSLYIIFGVAILIALIALIFRACNQKEITLNYSIPEVVFAGDMVKFSDSTENAESWEWNFGDNNGMSTDQSPDYLYKTAGDYTVTLTVNNKFHAQKKIRVESKHVVPKRITPVAKWEPGTPRTGKKIRFSDLTPGAVSWQWVFDGDEGPDTNRQTYFTFPDEGTHTVSLKVTGTDFFTDTTYQIDVLESKITLSSKETGGKSNDNSISDGKGSGKLPNIIPSMAGIQNNVPYDLCPLKYGKGDNDYGGNIHIQGHVELRISNDRKKIYACVFAYFIENGGWKDTKAKIDGNLPSGQIEIYAAPLGKKIFSTTHFHMELFDWSPPYRSYDTLYQNYYDSFVHRIEAIGNVKKGKELPCDSTKKTKTSGFRIFFNDFQVKLIDE
jgi:PKD domain-containing protein